MCPLYFRPSKCPYIFDDLNVLFIFDHLNVLYVFDQTDLYRLKSGSSSTAQMPRLGGSSPFLSPSHPPTPPPNRLPQLSSLPPLAKFQLVWRRLGEALLFSSSLAGGKHQSLLTRLCLICRRYKGRFALNMIKYGPLGLRTQWMR